MSNQNILHFPKAPKRRRNDVYFKRDELDVILNIYGRMVAAGEWRDYAINHSPDAAIFSAFRRASERPIYEIIKDPSLKDKQGQYYIRSMDGRIRRRGHDLKTVLKMFEAQLDKQDR